jgi:hypothetical protein
MAGCGAELEANDLINQLTTDAAFPIPNVNLNGAEFQFPGGTDGPLYKTLQPIAVEDLTDGQVTGPGVFDALMRGFKAHLKEEWDAGRITGNEYTKTYIALTESAMNQGVAFLLGKDQAFWQAQLAQVQAFTARVALETTKIQLAATQFEAANQKANYALTKMRMSSESAQYCISQFQLSQLMPLEKAGQELANDTATYNLASMLPQQLANLVAQNNMFKEQTEAQRAQTMDTRVDGTPIVGVLGKQKDLYTQQITSYKRDAEMKVAKLFSDSWITQKTIDEGLIPPNSFTNAEIEKVMVDIRQKNDIGV